MKNINRVKVKELLFRLLKCFLVAPGYCLKFLPDIGCFCSLKQPLFLAPHLTDHFIIPRIVMELMLQCEKLRSLGLALPFRSSYDQEGFGILERLDICTVVRLYRGMSADTKISLNLVELQDL